ncbi:MAG: hypothetical protein WD601_11900, partial [Pseudohongiellaceae bacterium]
MSKSDNLQESLQGALRNLGERQKELDALYRIIRLLLDDTLSTTQTLQRVAQALPAAMQHPDHAGAMIEYGGQQY